MPLRCRALPSEIDRRIQHRPPLHLFVLPDARRGGSVGRRPTPAVLVSNSKLALARHTLARASGANNGAALTFIAAVTTPVRAGGGDVAAGLLGGLAAGAYRGVWVYPSVQVCE